jgi:uncharacterized membrane protein
VRREPALWPAVVVAALLLGVSFFVLAHWLERGALSDTPVYQQYSAQIRSGQVPYRDFAVEYPPAALPAFVLPSYLPWSFATSFAVLMGVCGAGCLAAAAAALRAVGAGAVRGTAALLLIAVSPLTLGSLFDTRFDLWPVLLALCALVAALRERPLLSGALGGLAFAAKLWPAALAPIALLYLRRRRGGRATLAAAVAFAVVAAACFVPFAVLSPGGIRHSLTGQLDRPLQIESLGAAVLIASEHAGAKVSPTVTSHGSQTLSGRRARVAADVTSVLEIVAILAVWIGFARKRRPSGEAVLVSSAATVAAFVAFGKVFSPQFLIWLVPLVPLVRGLRGVLGSALLVAALALTQAWFPGNYWALALDHASPWSWYLLARDLLIVALAGVLAWPRLLEHDLLGEHRSLLEALETIRTQVE